MGRGGFEPPTHGFSVRATNDVSSFKDNDLQNTQSEMGRICGFSAQKNGSSG
jgi:hypothetical protein